MYIHDTIISLDGSLSGDVRVIAHYEYTYHEGFAGTQEEPEEPASYEVRIKSLSMAKVVGFTPTSFDIGELYTEYDDLEAEIAASLLIQGGE